MGNKVKYNLKNVHVAKLTETEVNGERSYSYATPRAVPGAVSLSLEAEGESTPFYADGIVYFRSVTNNGYSGDLEYLKQHDAYTITRVNHHGVTIHNLTTGHDWIMVSNYGTPDCYILHRHSGWYPFHRQQGRYKSLIDALDHIVRRDKFYSSLRSRLSAILRDGWQAFFMLKKFSHRRMARWSSTRKRPNGCGGFLNRP